MKNLTNAPSSSIFKHVGTIAACLGVLVIIAVMVKITSQANILHERWQSFSVEAQTKSSLLRTIESPLMNHGIIHEIESLLQQPNSELRENIERSFDQSLASVRAYQSIDYITEEEGQALVIIGDIVEQISNKFQLIFQLDTVLHHAQISILLSQMRTRDATTAINNLQEAASTHVQTSVDIINQLLLSLLMSALVIIAILPLLLAFTVSLYRQFAQLMSRPLFKHNANDAMANFFKFSPMAIVVLNRAGDIINANSEACNMLGLSREQLKSMHLEQFVVPDERANFTALRCNDVKINDNENPPIHIDVNQQVLPIEFFIHHQYGDNTDTVIVTLRDMTVQLELVNLMEQQHAMFTHAQQMTELGSWKWEFSTDTLIWSDETYKIYGFDVSAETVTNESVMNHIPSDQREDVGNAINEAVVFDRPYHRTHQIIRQDGSRILVEQHGKVIRDNNNKATHMIGTISDITKQRETEQRLQVSNSIFENSQQAMAITDNRSNIIKINKAFSSITGFQSKDVIGEQLAHVNRGTFFDRVVYKDIWLALEKTGHWHGQLWNVHSNGSVYPTKQHFSVIESSDNTLTEYLCSFEDISQQKNLEQTIAQYANVEQLTLLPSRNVLCDRLIQAVKRHERDHKHTAVIIISVEDSLTQYSKKHALTLIFRSKRHDFI
ncbi:MAG: PAS domain S-box protein [Psychrobium sp.]|nr:PAS domain S-box protein [Psychrobium sp.]